jgi:hypothetical protein
MNFIILLPYFPTVAKKAMRRVEAITLTGCCAKVQHLIVLDGKVSQTR